MQSSHTTLNPGFSDGEININAQSEALGKLGEALLGAQSVNEALEIVGECAETYIGARRVSYAESEGDGLSMRITGLVGTSSGSEGILMPIADAGIEDVLLKNQSAFYPDLSKSTVTLHHSLCKAGLTQAYSVAVLGPNLVTASLNIATESKQKNLENYFPFIHTLSKFLAAALQRINSQAESQKILTTLIDENPMMTTLLDENGQIVRVSRFGSCKFDFEATALEGKPFEYIHRTDTGHTAAKCLLKWNAMHDSEVDISRIRLHLGNGQQHWVRQSARKVLTVSGRTQYLIVWEDIQDLVSLTEKIQEQARLDPLTGLQNRVEFDKNLAKLIQRTPASNARLAVMFIDLDHFKEINDTLGHQVGDEVLRIIAQRLQSFVSGNDQAGRIGGDEFVVLLADYESTERLTAIAQNMIDDISQSICTNAQILQISATIGICRYPEDVTTGNELVKSADIAMYRAKELGGNRLQLYSREMARDLVRRTALARDIESAIEGNQLRLVFQPQYSIVDKHPVGVEALLRWNHPEFGELSPAYFIPILEANGKMPMLSDWVLENGLKAIARINDRFGSMRLAVNISASEFSSHSQLVNRIKRLKARDLLPEGRLELELTETALLKHPEHAKELLLALEDLGVQIAIDDFGTGYASLSYLVHLPIKTIKIDRSFVDGVEHDSRKQAVIRGIVGIARGLGVDCIGEGVETESQLQWLEAEQCSHVQGYLFCHAVSEPELMTLFDRELSSRQSAA